MSDSSQSAMNNGGKTTMQLSLRMPESKADGEWEIVSGAADLPTEVQQRVEVIQQLMAARGTKHYAKVQQQVAKRLGISVRSLRRLVKSWQEQGIAGLSRQIRSDQGAVKISLDWQKFMIKTYREGNRGSQRMSRAQVAVRVRVRAQELGDEDYPSRTSVYRILRPYIEKQQQQKRSIGWRGDRLRLKTREGIEIPIEWSNQVWQCDHTRVDVLVVDAAGEILGRPTLSIVVDTYSRCIMGMHLGFDAPSAAVVCLALRHAILPKQYSSAYELLQSWDTYGLPQYLYTDGGKDFRSEHIEQVATELGIVLCLRRKPSDGGIVERPFGTFNSEFFSTLPGYTSSNVVERSPDAESQACLTLQQLERLLVRYIVDRYNQTIDARVGNQTRIGRWSAGRMAQLPLLGDRELDICLMRRERRTVYRNGYIQFANLTYLGEHLAAYAGESVIIRYNPYDITTIYIYQLQNSQEVFLTRAHAQGWETEILSYKEAQAIAQRRRKAAKALDNRSMLQEVRARDATIEKVQRQKKYNSGASGKLTSKTQTQINTNSQLNEPKEEISTVVAEIVNEALIEPNLEQVKLKKPVPYVRVYEDYEQIKR
ncbi:MAG: Mu transposase C-terminal domain-containing protein, partial [Chroococcidiopsis sp.]